MSEYHKVYIAIGSNQERERSICYALDEIQHIFGTIVVSPIYESKPYGFVGDNFFNLVLCFESAEPVEQVNQQLKSIEQALPGNLIQGKCKSRKLDIDLLLFGYKTKHGENIQLPRPDIERYAFVLKPLSDVAPDMKHPILNKSFSDMWVEYRHGKSDIRRVEFNPFINKV